MRASRRGRTILQAGVIVGVFAFTLLLSQLGVPVPAATPNQFVMAFAADPSSLYPPKVGGIIERLATKQIFDSLVHRDTSGKLVGRLAERWERINPTTWRFFLRKNVTFQDGESVDATAVKMSLDIHRDPHRSVSASRFRSYRDVKVVDPYTVEIVTSEADPFVANNLADYGWVMPPKYLQEKGEAGFAAAPIGSGPYRFKEWIKSDRIILEANDNYFLGKPKIPTVVWRTIPDPSTRVSALLAGEVDLVWEVPPALVDQVRARQGLEVRTIPSPRAVYIGINAWAQGAPPALKDARVRQALNYAVNRQAMISSLLRGFAQPIGQPLPNASYNGFNPQVKPYPYDPERAKSLLKDAGAQGLALHLHFADRWLTREQAEAVGGDLDRVGVKVILDQVEYTTFVNDLFAYKPGDLYSLSIQGNQVIDGTEIYNIAIASFGSFNWNKYKNVQVDGLLRTAATSFDPKVRESLLRQAALISHDDPPWIYMWNNHSIWGVRKDIKWAPRADDLVSVYEDVNMSR